MKLQVRLLNLLAAAEDFCVAMVMLPHAGPDDGPLPEPCTGTVPRPGACEPARNGLQPSLPRGGRSISPTTSRQP